MDKITQINVEGHNYGFVAGQTVRGVSGAQAADYVKIVTLPEGASLTDGMLLAVTFVNGNTAGFAGTQKAYSSDGQNFYWDSQLTDPITLPPVGCYTMTLVSDEEYDFRAYPVWSINGSVQPFCDSRGHPCGGPLWASGDTVTVINLDGKFVALQTTCDEVKAGVSLPITSNAVYEALQNIPTVVDVVEEGNMNPVTSNGVFTAVDNATSIKLPSVTQVLANAGGPFSANTKTKILGAYDYQLFNIGIPVPTGYHKEYILSAQITTTNTMQIRARLNNIATTWGRTYSASTFRLIVCSNPFKASDIVLEPVLSYTSRNGTNLYIETDSGSGQSNIYNICLTCFLVKD